MLLGWHKSCELAPEYLKSAIRHVYTDLGAVSPGTIMCTSLPVPDPVLHWPEQVRLCQVASGWERVAGGFLYVHSGCFWAGKGGWGEDQILEGGRIDSVNAHCILTYSPVSLCQLNTVICDLWFVSAKYSSWCRFIGETGVLEEAKGEISQYFLG